MTSTKRKKIVVLIDWYLPGYKAGGPIQSVASMVARMKDEFDFAIITSDTDASETSPLAGVKSDEWNITKEGTRVYYFSKKKRSYNTLKKLMLAEQADVFYLNSLSSPNVFVGDLKKSGFPPKACGNDRNMQNSSKGFVCLILKFSAKILHAV